MLVVSLIQLLFPVNLIMEWYFTLKTNRKSPEIGVNFWNEGCLFFIVLYWIFDYMDLSVAPNMDASFFDEQEYTTM